MRAPLRPAVLGLAAAAGLASPAVARAAEPRPDRPMLTATGDLVASRSFEVEAGGAWRADAVRAPLRLKFGGGIVEPRIGVDLSGMNYGQPGLDAGVKLGIVRDEAIALAGYVESLLPVGYEERWTSEAGFALTARLSSGTSARFNAGMALTGDEGFLTVSGIPLRGLIAFPMGRRVEPFAEAEAIIGPLNPAWSVNGGLLLWLTDSLAGDAAFGWNIETSAPLIQLGLTANAGLLR